uniref:RING-CH-type domain-containing protein n=1 Tax=viral metagenome TaxID=1070528 RepID=A0A6C0CJB7_9ZZZZ
MTMDMSIDIQTPRAFTSPREVELKCRVCLENDGLCNLISPCDCDGSMKYVHLKCIQHFETIYQHASRGTCPNCKSEYNETYTPPASIVYESVNLVPEIPSVPVITRPETPMSSVWNDSIKFLGLFSSVSLFTFYLLLVGGEIKQMAQSDNLTPSEISVVMAYYMVCVLFYAVLIFAYYMKKNRNLSVMKHMYVITFSSIFVLFSVIMSAIVIGVMTQHYKGFKISFIVISVLNTIGLIACIRLIYKKDNLRIGDATRIV